MSRLDLEQQERLVAKTAEIPVERTTSRILPSIDENNDGLHQVTADAQDWLEIFETV